MIVRGGVALEVPRLLKLETTTPVNVF